MISEVLEYSAQVMWSMVLFHHFQFFTVSDDYSVSMKKSSMNVLLNISLMCVSY